MKNLYIIKVLILMLFCSSEVFADFRSKDDYTGNYEDDASWVYQQWNPWKPDADGTTGAKIVISKTSHITRNGVLKPVSVEVSGVLVVKGDFISSGWGHTVKTGGKLEIFGNLTVSDGVKVEKGGVLIVHGNLTSTGSSINIEGTALIVGNFSSSSNTEINNSGNLVVGGDFAHAGGGMSIKEDNLYILNPDANVNHPGSGDINEGKYGDADDFIANEGDDLKDLVDSVMPETVSPKYKWVGSQNSVWTNVENWNGSLPRSKSSVIIENKGHNPEILSGDGLVELKSLTINSNAVLTLKPGARLTVNGDLIIEKPGGLRLENRSSVNGLASLITKGSVTGEVEVNLTLPTNQWYYLSSPMKSVEYSHFGNGAIGAKVYGYRGKKWQEVPVSPALSPLEGTLTILPPSEGTHTTLSYSGKINTGIVSHTLTAKDYYLFGNPYPSSINWQDENWKRDRIYGTIWYRTRVGGEMAFVTYNRFAHQYARVAMYPDNTEMWNEEAMALIPPYQSVWIYSKTASADSPVTLTVSPEQRVHGVGGGTLKSSKDNSKADILRLVVQNESSRDGTVIYFSENTTNDFDLGDSPKYFNGSVKIPEVYTRSAGQTLAINGLAPFEGSLDLPLSVRNRVEGPVDMHFDLSLYRSDDVILLHDQYLDVEINLREVPQYRYEPTKLGDSHDRFVLRFNPTGYEDVSTNLLEEMASEGSTQINIVGINGRAIVSIGRELLAQGAGKIEVYSIEGLKMSEAEARTNKTFLVLPPQAGVYIVVVSASGERKVKKLLR